MAASFIPFFDLGVLSERNLFGDFLFSVTGLGSFEGPAEEGLGVRGGVKRALPGPGIPGVGS